MGKKSTRNPDAFERINFLYQAAHLALLTQPQPNLALARYHVQSLKLVASRLVLRIDPSMRRTLCKHCHLLLIPGLTCTVRLQPKRETHVVVTCRECKTFKRFLARRHHELWPDARLEPNPAKRAELALLKAVAEAARAPREPTPSAAPDARGAAGAAADHPSSKRRRDKTDQ